MRVAVLFSGGKDSAYATHLCLAWGWEVEWLTLHPPQDSMMFHHPNTKWTELQAKAAGIKLTQIRARSHESELADLEAALKKMKIDGIVSGAVGSEYQKQRIEGIGEHLNLPTFAPLWHKNDEVLGEILEQMEVYFASVSAEGLGKEWLGKRYMPADIAKLQAMRPAVNPFLEGGEGETFVADAPFFKKKIVVEEWARSFDGVRGVAGIKKAKLEAKK